MLARLRKTHEENDEGFTLIELLVVIIIIGILAAIAIPTFLNQRQKGYDAQAKSDLKTVATLEETFLTDIGSYTTTVTPGGTTSATAIGYKQSPNTAAVAVTFVNSAGAATAGTTDAKVGFCVTSKSDSGKFFGYNSIKGGLTAGSFDTAAAAC